MPFPNWMMEINREKFHLLPLADYYDMILADDTAAISPPMNIGGTYLADLINIPTTSDMTIRLGVRRIFCTNIPILRLYIDIPCVLMEQRYKRERSQYVLRCNSR